MADDPTPAPAPAPPPAPTPAATPTFEEALGKREALDFAKDAWRTIVKQKERETEILAKLPGKDQVIALATDLAELAAYRAHGKPEEVKARIDKSAELESAQVKRDRLDTLTDVAKAAGFADTAPKLLEKYVTDQVFKIEEKTVGKVVSKIAHVVTQVDGKEVLTKIEDYAAKHWPEIMAALKPSPAVPRPGSPTTLAFNPRPAITADATPKTRRNQF